MPKNPNLTRFLPYPTFGIASDEEIFSKHFFWDVKINELDKKKDAHFIISRVLEYGDVEHINWLFTNYQKKQIIQVIRTSKSISPKVANFWKLLLNIKGKIRCLEPQYLKMREKIWPH